MKLKNYYIYFQGEITEDSPGQGNVPTKVHRRVKKVQCFYDVLSLTDELCRMGHSIFYPHAPPPPPNDGMFLPRRVRIFSSKKPTIFGPFGFFFSKVPTKK